MLLTHWEDAEVRIDNEQIPEKNVFTFKNRIQKIHQFNIAINVLVHLSVLRWISITKRAGHYQKKLFIFHFRMCVLFHADNLANKGEDWTIYWTMYLKEIVQILQGWQVLTSKIWDKM